MTSKRTTALMIAVAAFFSPIQLRAELPPDLAAVPGDAVGFAHIRAADVWKSEFFKDLREMVLKSGDQALQALEKRFLPSPSTLDRVTAFMVLSDRGPMPVIISTFTKPVDAKEFIKQSFPEAKERPVPKGTAFVDEDSGTAIYFPSDRSIALGPTPAVGQWLKEKKPAEGALLAALNEAASGKPITVCVNASAIPQQLLFGAPPYLAPLLKAKLITLTLDLAGDGKLELRLIYADGKQADAAADSAKAVADLARQSLNQMRGELMKMVVGDGKAASIKELPMAALAVMGLGSFQQYDDFLANLPLKKSGESLVLMVSIPKGVSNTLSTYAVSIGLLLPAVQKVREAAARVQSQNNMKQMGIAMHTCADATKGFPAASICDKRGKPLLSWRVAILPYIEADDLYKQFHLDEPWDSEHNKKLIPRMPKIYAVPAALTRPGESNYRVFVGNGAAFDWVAPAAMPAAFQDGLSNTILIVEAADSVPWTKPDELEFDPKKPLPKLGGHYSSPGFNALLGDGSVRFISTSISEKTLKAAITRAGGEVLGEDW